MRQRIYRIGTRRSQLALRQVEEVLRALRRFYPDIKTEVIGIDTAGDRDKITPISDIEGSDFFTHEIDLALLNGDIDFAVHSAKDLADEAPQGLHIAAITKSGNSHDALVAKNGLKLDELKPWAKIGASSFRRKKQLKEYRPDLEIIDIRGNIEERLERLDGDGLDAVVVAACALFRLGLGHRITQEIPFEILMPHPLQGALAIEIRSDDKELIRLLEVIDER